MRFKQFIKKEITEAKKVEPQQAPRHEKLNAALVAKKGGGHFSKKVDYKRPAEKQKLRKEMMEDSLEEAHISSVTAATGQGRKHSIEMVLSSEELAALVGEVQDSTDERLTKVVDHLKKLYARAGKKE